ncbi:hypothetical protein PUN28_005790 [Cardiocondyla obscurior]|uniref:Ribosomal protein S15 n=1 Tax=Cardiocondyla obscurior TaxID=286306 RepID=A0AAW2G8I1_9HYME
MRNWLRVALHPESKEERGRFMYATQGSCTEKKKEEKKNTKLNRRTIGLLITMRRTYSSRRGSTQGGETIADDLRRKEHRASLPFGLDPI